jgi:hypothetical protein
MGNPSRVDPLPAFPVPSRAAHPSRSFPGAAGTELSPGKVPRPPLGRAQFQTSCSSGPGTDSGIPETRRLSS